MSTEELLFPAFNYYLDESDSDKVILRRQDDSFVAAFSASGATKEASSKPLRNYRELIRTHINLLGRESE